MKRHLSRMLLAACVALGAATGAATQNVDPNSELGQFRDRRAAGIRALDDGDLTMASQRLAQAAAIIPDSPSILLLRTQVALQQKRKAEAKTTMAEYLNRGYVLDLARHTDFNAIWDSALEDQLVSNQSAVGEMHVTSTLPGFTLTDAMTYAPNSEQMFLSHVRTGKVTALTAAGSRDVVSFRPGVAAYGLGLRENQLWATTAATRQTKTYDPKLSISSKVVVIDPANGQILQSFTAGDDRRFGHLLMGRDDLYVADTTHGEILRLNRYQGALEALIPEGYLDAPMGIVESEDATILIVADFISGLYRIDLTAGSMMRILPPETGSTLGFSSMSRHGKDIVAIQTGFEPNRIVRLRMSDDWSQITAVDTVLRSKQLSQPTQGLVTGDHYIFVARSQWDNLDGQGNPVAPEPEPAVIGAVKLQ
ncbi:hypothetical protein ABI_28700 [Asticcacaulis biprosthecium C19]|uniref:NHL repeat family protein n=1 Tax=Asticcacaulis biprosthecium C19 TaxID=715226 RepID=F4QML3_9CAUL|nr:tetratricopeptide repeat protein [Asticcacaulis biprosthecium]EGF91454.1 hypothetical protein ABI_28700 [Asticcacaulis biprosthecium C19]